MKNALSKLLKSVNAAMGPVPLQVDLPEEWLHPIDHAGAHGPSGPSLEYDPEFAVLAARLKPKSEVQYGPFTAAATEPDWKEIERDCRRMMLRSKDLNLLVWFTRSRTRQAGALGLLQGMSALQQICERFGETVHPQLHFEGEFDPMVRANTLAALCDPEGLMQDVREVLIVSGTAQRLTVRDVERSHAVPRPPYAPPAEVIHRQLEDLYLRQDGQLMALQASAACAQFLHEWAQVSMADDAPSLQPLIKLLQPLLGTALVTLPVPAQRVHAEAVDDEAQNLPGMERTGTASSVPAALVSTSTPWSAALPSGSSAELSREQVREALMQVRAWIEHHEPSSPVSVLLKQAERMWGKRFSEVAHMIPPDLLKAWDQGD